MRAPRAAPMLAAALVSASASAQGSPVVDGYDALWRTVARPAFTSADEKPLDDPQTVDRRAYRAWDPAKHGGARVAGRRDPVAWLGDDVTIGRHAFPFSRATVFPGEPAGEPGADARLFVGARDVCLQGTPPSASGTAQRHVHVMVIVEAFTPAARRYDLPSLFGSCLALTRGGAAGLAFLAGAYHIPQGSEVSDGVDFEHWRLRDGRFSRAPVAPLRIRFVDPGNVYRFEVLAP